jgi:dihydroorotate dehydrogenase (fumarate)
MTGIDLSTPYLGLRLASPFMAGASPLADKLDTVRRLEDAGCSAIVMHSLFEEQITEAVSGRIHQMDPLDPRFAPTLAYFPDAEAYLWGPDEYLEHLRRIKAAVRMPVVASLNGTSAGAWLKFAQTLEQAGADALELNPYDVVTDAAESGATVEHTIRLMVEDLKRSLKIPVAVKLSPFFTALPHLARELERAGAGGLVLFNRFLQPDIDLRTVAVWPRLELSDSSELLLRLRWLAILRGQSRGSLAASGGGAPPAGGRKAPRALLAGADAVQMVSAILRYGPSYFVSMREELGRWMDAHGFASLAEVRGRLSLENTSAPGLSERAHYLRTLSGWSSWLTYQKILEMKSSTPDA